MTKQDSEDSGLLAVIDSRLFTALEEDTRKQLVAQSTEVSFSPGATIMREGDLGDEFYVVKEGHVCVMTTRDERPMVLAELGRGACLGEVGMLLRQPRTATVVAKDAVTLLRFYRRDVEPVLDEYPRIRKMLETVVESRARDTIEKITGAKPDPSA